MVQIYIYIYHKINIPMKVDASLVVALKSLSEGHQGETTFPSIFISKRIIKEAKYSYNFSKL